MVHRHSGSNDAEVGTTSPGFFDEDCKGQQMAKVVEILISHVK